MSAQAERATWGSRLGFVLAAAGSAVGLGNIWKFPYITGENGGGAFVFVYVICVVVVGLPVMLAEVLIGRASHRSPVGAFKRLAGDDSPWRFVGWAGVACGFVILSYYSVVTGWSLHYILLALRDAFSGADASTVDRLFGELYVSAGTNVLWHMVVMAMTTGVVIAGVRRGVESAAKTLMPALLIILVVLFVDALFQKGFGQAARFLFEPRFSELTLRGTLEALGHAFFTLSVGMGAMLTYGSYLPDGEPLGKATTRVAGLDTLVALIACLVLFPVLFTFGMPPEAGPGLVFKSMPLALRQLGGGQALCVVFFVLLFFAALSSAISLLEVVTSTLVDELQWRRRSAALAAGVTIALLGIPSALSGGTAVRQQLRRGLRPQLVRPLRLPGEQLAAPARRRAHRPLRRLADAGGRAA
jgi:NSS family neurotransmitter:Na+ symporter